LIAQSNLPVSWYDQAVGGNLVETGTTFQTPVLTETTIYYAESNNGCASERVQVNAIVNAVPDPPLTTNGNACDSGTVQLTASAGAQIFWFDSPSGGTAIGSGSNFITPSLSSIMTYYAEAQDVCSSPRIPATAIINLSPLISLGNDTIINTGNTIVLDAGSGFTNYLWSTGDTTQSISVNSTDVYSVQVTDANGCSGTDMIQVSVVVGIQSELADALQFLIYPNPVNDELTVAFGRTDEKIVLSVTDMTGKTVYKQIVSAGISSAKINCSGFSKGVYYLRILSEKSNATMGFVKE
jgi:hypothetical protein